MFDIYEAPKAQQPTAVKTHMHGRNTFTSSVTKMRGFLQSCLHLFYDSKANQLFKDSSLPCVNQVIL